MNRDDIIRMALEVDAYSPPIDRDWAFEFEDLERFVALVAAAAKAEEREACIEDCEALGDSWRQGYLDGVKSCIAVIRARGEEPKRHPGYIVGDHWLQLAYSHVCAGDDEAEVMANFGYKREKS